ncbi:MAG: 50S ribosomal protein L25 [Candidatus Daviesbacteria bacterium]|nr:MAG: 50S ribosomal protein L25 [Candidatus Daviesbacteria bacterium]
MDRLSLHATERKILGKKVKKLRRDGLLPAHVYGKAVENESVTVAESDFLKIFHLAGETGLIDLKIGQEKVRPVLVRDVQYDPVQGTPMHIDFYQVNLSEKVRVPVPIVLVGEEPEAVHLGEAIVLQTLNEVEVEALPTDLVERLEVDQVNLKQINDAITIADLNYDKEKLTILAGPEEIVVKLAPAVSAETQELLEEQAAEQAAATEAEEGAEGEEGEPASTEAIAGKGEAPSEGEAAPETPKENKEDKGE